MSTHEAGNADVVRPRLVVFDLDGVLADVAHRVHHVTGGRRDWDAFFAAAPADPVHAAGRALLVDLIGEGRVAAYLTGRPERCRADTLAWLAEHGLPAGPLLMRPAADRRPARLVKAEALAHLARDNDIDLVVDDDPEVVATLRSRGFTVHHALWGRPDDVGVVLSAIQQEQGRT